MAEVTGRERGRAVGRADHERGDAEVAGPRRRIRERDRLADPVGEALERVRAELAIRAAGRQRRAEVQLAEGPVLEDPQDQAEATVAEVGLAISGAPLDGHAPPGASRWMVQVYE